MVKYIMKLSKLFEMSLFKVVMKTFENDSAPNWKLISNIALKDAFKVLKRYG